MNPNEVTTIFRDFGSLGLGLATIFYLARSIYALSQRNGSRAATLNDVVRAIETHAEEERQHHEHQAERETKFVAALAEMRSDIWRLIGRSEAPR